jgi:KaiC/GvpD/RAD55 family RecA-like ATPase
MVKKETDEKHPARISSGIKEFDSLIEGGFETYSVNLVVADIGSGKTILAMQFLVDGLKKGEKCLYVTFEEKKEEFYSNMMDFGWDLEKYEKEGKFFFLEYNPEKVKVMLEEGGGEIEGTVFREKVSRMVIDSVTSFALLFENELEKREAALRLFDMIRKWKCTSILTLQEDPQKRTQGESTALEYESDSITLLHFIRINEERQRFIEILKMRGTNHSTKIYEFNIDKDGVKIGKSVLMSKIFPK